MNPVQNSAVIPLLGTLTPQQLKDTLIKTMSDEASAADFYTELMSQAPNGLHYDFIQHARDDEVDHLSRFQNLYVYYFGTIPQYSIQKTQNPSYEQGLLMALDDELAAAEFYRDVQLSVTDQMFKDTYYYAMVDELDHATRFSTLFNQ